MGLMESKAGAKFLFQRFNREPIAVVTVYVGYFFYFFFGQVAAVLRRNGFRC